MSPFLRHARVSTLHSDINALRSALAGYYPAAAFSAHAKARRWWACSSPALCCRAGLFGRASTTRVYRDFTGLDAAAKTGDFEAMIEAWALCERWVSCLEPEAPACQGQNKEAA